MLVWLSDLGYVLTWLDDVLTWLDDVVAWLGDVTWLGDVNG